MWKELQKSSSSVVLGDVLSPLCKCAFSFHGCLAARLRFRVNDQAHQKLVMGHLRSPDKSSAVQWVTALGSCTCFECGRYFSSFLHISSLFSHAYSQRSQHLVAGCNNIALWEQLTFPLEASWRLVCTSTAIIPFAKTWKAFPAIILELYPKWLLIHCVLCALVHCP